MSPPVAAANDAAQTCFFGRVGAALAGWLTRLPQPLTLRFGRLLALLVRPLLRRRWQVARVNLTLCFADESEAQREARLRAHQEALPIAVLELLRAWFAPRSALAGLAEVEGLHHLQEAEARGQGVLLMTGHLMHTELAVRFLGEANGRLIPGVVRRYDRHPCLERTLDAARCARVGPTVSKFDTRGMIRTLREGLPLVNSADQDFRTQQVFVPFFGVPAATLSTLPQLVKAGRACVRFFAMVREPNGRYRVRVWDPGLDALVDDAEAFAARYMFELEAAVRAAPEQYLWVHRRFKTRPNGAPSPYG